MPTKGKRSLRAKPSGIKQGASPLRAPYGTVHGIDELARQGALDRISRDRTATVTEALAAHPTVSTLCSLVEGSYKLFNHYWEQFEFSPPIVCKRGCSHCCNNQISLSQAEAVYLGLYVAERFSDTQLSEVARKVETVLHRIKGKSRMEIGAIRHLTPCPFLVEDACSVHPARPFACRGWNSVSVEQCRLSVENHDPMMMIESYEILRDLAGGLQLGLMQGTQSLGLEAGYLIITRAAYLMQEYGAIECADAWLKGEAFFGRPMVW